MFKNVVKQIIFFIFVLVCIVAYIKTDINNLKQQKENSAQEVSKDIIDKSSEEKSISKVSVENLDEKYIDNLADRIIEYKENKEKVFYSNDPDTIMLKRISERYYGNSIEKKDLKAELKNGGYFTNYNLSETREYPKNSEFSASVKATLRIYRNGDFAEITEVLGEIFSEAVTETNKYQWVEGTVGYTPQSLPTTKITIVATGYFKIPKNFIKGIEFNIHGFNASISSGTIRDYYSDNMIIEKSFSTI
ncbi:hypothetical protein [Peptoniphilus asaccharolyticus]